MKTLFTRFLARVLLLDERMHDLPGDDFDAFIVANADLSDRNVLMRWCSDTSRYPPLALVMPDWVPVNRFAKSVVYDGKITVLQDDPIPDETFEIGDSFL